MSKAVQTQPEREPEKKNTKYKIQKRNNNKNNLPKSTWAMLF